MSNHLDPPSLAWIDDISTLRPKPSPLELALWLDSFVIVGRVIDPGPLPRVEMCLRAWPPRARA